MKDYNPVSGNPLDPTYGLQDAYQKRIDTIKQNFRWNDFRTISKPQI
jgi:hypothetical protein